MSDDGQKQWWDSAIIYEVYPRSFADWNGDGVGDLRGLIQKLPYIASLGVHGIWLTPFQTSPQVDQGYDISDYCDVDPLFGNLADVDELLSAAHGLGLKVLVDIVPNHCSIEHPLFKRALASSPGSPERDMFHFADGGGERGETPPNNWISVFGGPAWAPAHPGSADDTQWFLHLFSAAQPDWNWRNPAVTDYFDGVLRFWFDRGVDGIRIDVAHGLFKAEGLPDAPEVPTVIDGLRSNPLVTDQEPVHDVYRRWRSIAEEYDPARLLVGEVNLEPQRAGRYTRSDELHQAFAFAFARLSWSGPEWVSAGSELEQARHDYGAAPSWALENHDLVRTVTRFGGGERGEKRARAAIVALLGLPGSVYVYQGQELGLPEVDVPVGSRADPMWTMGGVSRDGARIPLPWTERPSATYGFSRDSTAAAPWLPTPPNWGERSVERQEGDEQSNLHLFKSAVARRRALFEQGEFVHDEPATWQSTTTGLAICARAGGVSVVIAMGDKPAPLPAGTVLFSSSGMPDGGMIDPDTTVWLRRPS